MGKRSFQEVSVVATGTQRFNRRRGDDIIDRPQLARWRCNLTGLSQSSNLYFIAFGEDIHCYVPHFPSQQISEHPVLVVPSKPLNSEPTGFVDPYHPHAVNNLVVQLLGNEEVVATVRDDGDVVIFLVRHILQAIERRCEPKSSFSDTAHEIRPIFQRNVGMSAWGLAIHTNARTVAVSANTHNVTVFRFGLVGEGVGEDQAEDVLQRVVNGTANIPHIAFCNTGDDPGARWLLTTDISGYCRTIDLQEMVNSQTFRFGRSMVHHTHDPFNSGWGIMFLDRQSFVPEDSIEAALGLEASRKPPRTNEFIWDISRTAAYVPHCNTRFPSQLRVNRRHDQASSTATGQADSPLTQTSPTLASVPTANTDSGGETSVTEQVESADESDMSEDEGGSAQDEGFQSEPDAEDPLRIFTFQPRCSTANNLCGDLPCPILHASVCNVYLMQPSNNRDTGQSPFSPPLVGFADALRQRLTGHHFLNGLERLNMHAYLPTLGVVILASQKGRALVLALTRISESVKCGLTIQRHPRTLYAMRIDHILPFAEQEDAGQRPLAPLAGIATGPIQGTERLPMGQKRWRLMLLYRDRTVLSYEIRRRQTRDSAVDVTQVLA